MAGVLALLVHVIFVVFMFFGLNWKTQPPEGMVVDLWQDMPQPVQTTVKQPPVKKEEPLQPKSPQMPAAEKSSPPKTTSPSPNKKPEIVPNEKKEELKPVAKKETNEELKKDIELEQQKQKEKEEAERVKQNELKKQKEKEEAEKAKENELRKQKEKEEAAKAEAQRLQREKELQQQREQEALAAQREAQQAAERARIMSEIDKYRAMILAKVRSRIVMPPDLPGNPVTEFSVTLLPGGDILDVQLRRSSGYASFDSAVERAIFLAKPLPLPPNPALFKDFRNLKITVHYLE